MNTVTKIRLCLRYLLVNVLALLAAVVAYDRWMQSRLAEVPQDDRVYIYVQFDNSGNWHGDYIADPPPQNIRKPVVRFTTLNGEIIVPAEEVLCIMEVERDAVDRDVPKRSIQYAKDSAARGRGDAVFEPAFEIMPINTPTQPAVDEAWTIQVLFHGPLPADAVVIAYPDEIPGRTAGYDTAELFVRRCYIIKPEDSEILYPSQVRP